MVTDSRIDAPVSETVKKTIQKIKEIFKDHSEDDIYVALKEANMDPNETTNKLLNQDPFHEVKSRRDRRKESVGYKDAADSRKRSESVAADPRKRLDSVAVDPRKRSESVAADSRKRSDSVAVDPRKRSENVAVGPRNRSEYVAVERSENIVVDQRKNSENGAVDPRKHSENVAVDPRKRLENGAVDPRNRSENVAVDQRRRSENVAVDSRKRLDNVAQGMKFHEYPDRIDRRRGFNRNSFPGGRIQKEFRVVRDNRLNQNTGSEAKPSSLQSSTSTSEQVVVNVTEKGSLGNASNQRPSSGSRNSSQASSAPSNSQPRHVRDTNLNGTLRDEKQTLASNASLSQAVKPNNIQSNAAVQSPSSSVLGVYSSSTDPVHVPSPESRSSNAVGAIKREVGVVGVRRQLSQIAAKETSPPSNSLSNALPGRDNTSESFRHVSAVSKADQPGHSSTNESVVPSISGNRSILTNHHGNRPHQQAVGHQRGTQNKIEWKPKQNQKLSTNNPGVIGTPKKSTSPNASDAKDLDLEKVKLQDELSQVNIHDGENVIIAQHIRVPENDRCQLTFGSFGAELDSSSLPISALDTSSDAAAAAAAKSVNNHDDQVRNSGSGSPSSGDSLEHHLPDTTGTSSPQKLDNYSDIGLIPDNSLPYAPPEPQQPQDPSELTNFSAYDLQTGYGIPPYFRPAMDDTARGQSLQSQEALISHGANSVSPSTIAMVQQQQPQLTQMYPQVQVSHYANLMPYRQFLSPYYVPQMAMPGYSSSPAYAHPSNASSYVMMPGSSSHLNANAMKYGVQQFKPVPAGSPSGFSGFTSPTGYAINAPGVAGNANGLEDSRIKYKDGNGNVFVQNQQDASDLWIQNPREMQSAPYYNVPGQTPHGAYMPSPHSGHASFNAAAAQSSHMQFPGLYHPSPQAAAMGNPHHLGQAMGAGVAPAAPGAQVGPYQQPQLGHPNWTTNF